MKNVRMWVLRLQSQIMMSTKNTTMTTPRTTSTMEKVMIMMILEAEVVVTMEEVSVSVSSPFHSPYPVLELGYDYD